MNRYGFIAMVLVAGCGDHPFHQDLKLGGQTISAERLNHGKDEYQSYCRPCHGERGDGKGFSSYGLRPPPRDFSQGLFKFGHVAAPALPPDEELVRIVRGGLHGTAMLPWDVPDGELLDILQYIKTFSPRWAAEEPGKLIEVSQDPFAGGKEKEAVELGEKLYHAKAQCSGCHPAFVTHEKLNAITKEMTGTGQVDFSAEMYMSQPKETEYCLEWKPGWKKIEDRECAHFVKILPPNFTRDKLRTVHEGTELVDLYRTIASGIGGANMPTWKGALKEDELWGLAYYVRSLVMMRDKEEAAQLAAMLKDPKNMEWKPAGGAPPTETPGKEAPPAPKTEKPAKKG
jgi:mono/diheme cytochrome c family protein